MVDPFMLCCSAGGIIAAVCFLIFGIFAYKKVKIMKDIPTSKILGIVPGLVEVNGNVQPLGLYKSPITGTDCVYHVAHLEQYRRSGKHSHWVTLFREDSKTDFFIADETGQVRVKPQGSKLQVPNNYRHQVGWSTEPDMYMRNFLSTRGYDDKTWLGFKKTLRLSEYVLRPGTRMYVLGTAQPDPSGKIGAFTIGKFNGKYLIVSTKTEAEISQGDTWKMIIGFVLAGLSFAFSIIILVVMIFLI